MVRAGKSASADGFTGVLVTPGPDLGYLCGYTPPATTERLTMLVVHPDRRPTLIVPRLERGDAVKAAGAHAYDLIDWVDGMDAYAVAATLIGPSGRYAISDSSWAMHLLGLQRTLPRTSYVSLTDGLPMLRGVKDAAELERLALAGAGADAAYDDIVMTRFAGRRETEVAADLADLLRRYGHSQVD